nr:envelope membrane protein [Rhamnoneuron balansae]URC16175.1 envelope membrane protein [Rhamnoneuron balansae]
MELLLDRKIRLPRVNERGGFINNSQMMKKCQKKKRKHSFPFYILHL